MNRTVIIITILTAILTVIYNLNQREEFLGGASRLSPSAPALDVAPSLRFSKPGASSISGLDMWNLTPYVPAGNLPSLKELFKPFYTLNKNGRFEALQRSDRPNERWELQGVLVRGNVPRALFYNAALRKMKNIGKGEQLDDQLRVRAIGTNSVTLEAATGKKPQLFELRIFNANKDQYAIKKKNS